MSNSPATGRPAKKQTVAREEGIAAFWQFSSDQESLTDSERLQQIKVGFPADLAHAFRLAFDLQERHLETLLNASISTLERRRREHKNLDPVASERLGRIAIVSHLAEEIFETQVIATHWMSTTNKALSGQHIFGMGNSYPNDRFFYVGITKRRWQTRWAEHLRAVEKGSQLLFHRKFKECSSL